MIRINLLKSVQSQRPMLLVEETNGGKRVWVFALIALLVISVGIFIFKKPSATKKPEVTMTETAPAAAPDTVPAVSEPAAPTADVAEEIVREAREEMVPATAPSTYSDLSPSQRVAFQQISGIRLLRDLQAVTPAEVGFARVIFTPPSEFYVYGIAANEEELKKFKSGLATLPGADIQESLSQPVGAAKVAREFSFFGKVNYPVAEALGTGNHVVAKDNPNVALNSLTAAAKELGMTLSPKLENTTTSGGLQRNVYRVEARCDYARLQSLLEKIGESKADMGVVRVALEAKGDEKMVASLDLVVYAQ